MQSRYTLSKCEYIIQLRNKTPIRSVANQTTFMPWSTLGSVNQLARCLVNKPLKYNTAPSCLLIVTSRHFILLSGAT